jgi:hypothetical protein
LEPCKPDDNPEPSPGNKKEEKVVYIGLTIKNFAVFTNMLLDSPEIPELVKTFHISANHPRIVKLLSEGKLQENKKFTIRYGKVDEKSEGEVFNTFNENNQELEIIETEET